MRLQDVLEGKRMDVQERSGAEHEELMQHPEVQEHLDGIICKHWESWVDNNIPALGGKSPREAVKSPDGLEAVEALLQEAERDRGQDPLKPLYN